MMFRESESDVQLSPQASKASSETPSPDTQSSPDPQFSPDPQISPDPQFSPDPRSTVNPDTYNRRHYESGYGTDYSPLSFGSPTQFTFSSEADDNVFELSQEIGDLQLEDPEFPFENEPNTDGDAEGDADAVGNDQAVETILSEGGEICSSRTVSDPIDIKPKRPRTPTPECNGSYQSSNAESVSGYTNFTQGENERFTCSSRNNVESSLDQYGLHLSTSLRSVATQTPPSMRSEAAHCQCLHRSDELPVLIPRGQPLDSSHVQTEDDVHVRPSAPLPDVVPFQRNRSASLPVVQPLRQSDEETVGRTLRRISDEFEFYHRERRRQQRASSLPQTSDLWNTLRRYFSSDSEGHDRNDVCHSQKDLHDFDGD